MNKWPDDELERQMLAAADLWPLSVSVANCACHIRALLVRVRELEKREDELTAACTEAEAHCSHLVTRGRLYGGEVEMRNDAIVQALRHALKGGRNEATPEVAGPT